ARPRRDVARAGEGPGADHAAGVEVVALVPAVVRDLVAGVRLDHREQRAAELDRLLAGVAAADGLDRRFGGHLSSLVPASDPPLSTLCIEVSGSSSTS